MQFFQKSLGLGWGLPDDGGGVNCELGVNAVAFPAFSMMQQLPPGTAYAMVIQPAASKLARASDAARPCSSGTHSSR